MASRLAAGDGRPVLNDAPNKANQTAGRKRKATEGLQGIDLDDIDVEGMMIDSTCNQVRTKIRRLLDSGTITKTAFANALGVTPKSLNGFLGHTGSMDGAGSDSYTAAWEYFKKRELAGIKMPTKKAAKTKASSSGAGAASAGGSGNSGVPDLTGIYLDGEDTDAVEVYDTCDEIRRKISAHLAKPGVTQAKFCRELAAQLHTRDQKMSASQLTAFRGKHGPVAGNESKVFYTAYVFFEKVRLAEGKPKSNHRLEMERRWPRGVNTDRRFNGFFCREDERPVMDSYGTVSIERYR